MKKDFKYQSTQYDFNNTEELGDAIKVNSGDYYLERVIEEKILID